MARPGEVFRSCLQLVHAQVHKNLKACCSASKCNSSGDKGTLDYLALFSSTLMIHTSSDIVSPTVEQFRLDSCLLNFTKIVLQSTFESDNLRRVSARSPALIPVVVPTLASTVTVKAVLLAS